ncbi:conserved domain protein [Peptoniphilus sp. oral taxon 375 str. F0436]|nr:conserved domain protein [Peptoniphilus sp. oral taxon 375 str. F0436]
MKIMLIEDHKMLAQYLKTDLESSGEIQVDILENRQELKKN